MKTKIEIFANKELHNFFLNLDKFFEINFCDYSTLEKSDHQNNVSIVFVENHDRISEKVIKRISQNENFVILFRDLDLFQKFCLNKNNSISSPVSINKFIDILNSVIFKKNHVFQNVKLNNYAVSNLKTDEKKHLTQAENFILLKLFAETRVKKRNLERDALHIKQEINTSSTESHLNRIRKKLKAVSSNFTISSKDGYVYLEVIT